MSKTFLITGGAGFIGSAVVRELIQNTDHQVINIDKLTYAGNLESLTSVADSPRYTFIQVLSKTGCVFSPLFIRLCLPWHR